MLEKNFAGLDNFIWWMGVVESRKDPLALGRCQVRIFGFHSDSLTDIPTADLPWAMPVHALNSHTFSTPKETDVVFGFFADGKNAQIPIMMGIVPGFETNPKNIGAGYHDLRDPQEIRYAPKTLVNREYKTDGTGIKLTEANTANNEVLETLRYPREHELDNPTISGITRTSPSANSVISARKENRDQNIECANNITWSEPYPSYNPLYPYNQAVETESGHVFELDDTPRNERISMQHRSGTYFEMFPSGSKVEKITKSNYQIIMGDDFMHVMGRVAMTVDSDVHLRVIGNVNLVAENDLSAEVSGNMHLSVRENLNIKAAKLNIDIAGTSTLVSGGSQYYTSGASIFNNAGSEYRSTSGGGMELKSGGGFRATAAGNADIRSGGLTNMQSSGTTNIVGSAVRLNSGGAASSAAQASPGKAAGINQAKVRGKKNDPSITFEQPRIPVPGNIFSKPDAVGGTAIKQDSFLQENPKDPDGDKEAPEPPPPQTCTFKEEGHTFLPASQWKIGQKGLDLIKNSEGYADQTGKYGATAPLPGKGFVKAYPDPATKGEPITIGYGTTGPAVDQKITYDTVIDKAKAEEYLAYAINKKFLPSLKNAIKVDMTQEMVDACLSLMYNIGAGNFNKSSVKTKANQKDWCGAGDAFLAWNKAGGKVLPGLDKRRQAERSLFLT